MISVRVGDWRWIVSETQDGEYIYCQGNRGGMIMTKAEWLLMLDAEWERKTLDEISTAPPSDMRQETD